jgi:DNA-binding transcriptional ArsR family regulator
MPSSTDVVFRALADSTRRRIIDLLAERGAMTVGELAAEFPDLVASGVSKHLMNLRASGLVRATRQGRKQIYRLESEALVDTLVPWIAKYEQYWTAALERLRGVAQAGGARDRDKREKKSRARGRKRR